MFKRLAVLPMANSYYVRFDGTKVKSGETLVFRSVHVVYCAKTFQVLPETSVCFELRRNGVELLVSYNIEYLQKRMAEKGIVPVSGGEVVRLFRLTDEGLPFRKDSYIEVDIIGWDNLFASALPECETNIPPITHLRSEETECRYFCSQHAFEQVTNLSGVK